MVKANTYCMEALANNLNETPTVTIICVTYGIKNRSFSGVRGSDRVVKSSCIVSFCAGNKHRINFRRVMYCQCQHVVMTENPG